MKQRRTSYRNSISRRTMLATSVAMAATPALADGCQVGPPHHHKGPPVFMDYDQLELDASYDQVYYEPLIAQVSQRLASNSEATRVRLGAPQRATDPRSATGRTRLPSPVSGETHAMPTQDGVGPNMRYVEIKSEAQLEVQSLHRVRGRLVAERTALINQLRALMLERGIAVAQGRSKLERYLPEILADERSGLGPRLRRLIEDMRSGEASTSGSKGITMNSPNGYT